MAAIRGTVTNRCGRRKVIRNSHDWRSESGATYSSLLLVTLGNDRSSMYCSRSSFVDLSDYVAIDAECVHPLDMLRQACAAEALGEPHCLPAGVLLDLALGDPIRVLQRRPAVRGEEPVYVVWGAATLEGEPGVTPIRWVAPAGLFDDAVLAIPHLREVAAIDLPGLVAHLEHSAFGELLP